MKNKFDIEFDWHLTNKCNFNCVYCHPQIKRILNTPDMHNYTNKHILNSFNRLGKTCCILMSGGEPYLFPDFINFCKELTKNHYISINSNFSPPNVEEFAELINPDKVININAALHILERERMGIAIDNFAKKVILYQNQGFNITVFYVLFPPLLKRFLKDFKKLKNMGIKSIAAKTFKGVYNGKLYPEGYTTIERKKIKSFKDDYKYNKLYLKGNMFFRGHLCNAGSKFFKIEVNGNVRRCPSSSCSLGNLYKGTMKINKKALPCETSRALSISQCSRYLLNKNLFDEN